MNADKHYERAELVESQQASLDPSQHWIPIVESCHTAAQHFCWAAIDRCGLPHHQASANHRHAQLPSLLGQVNAPHAVQDAWQRLEHLRTGISYGGHLDGVQAQEARKYLATIRGWVDTLPRP
jgi:hypothetical protein